MRRAVAAALALALALSSDDADARRRRKRQPKPPGPPQFEYLGELRSPATLRDCEGWRMVICYSSGGPYLHHWQCFCTGRAP